MNNFSNLAAERTAGRRRQSSELLVARSIKTSSPIRSSILIKARSLVGAVLWPVKTIPRIPLSRLGLRTAGCRSSLEYFRIFPQGVSPQALPFDGRPHECFVSVCLAGRQTPPTAPPAAWLTPATTTTTAFRSPTSWNCRNSTWLAKNTSGVLLVQIRASFSYRDRLDVTTPTRASRLGLAGFQFIINPQSDRCRRLRTQQHIFISSNDADVAALDAFHWEFGPDPTARERRAVLHVGDSPRTRRRSSLDPGDSGASSRTYHQGRSVSARFPRGLHVVVSGPGRDGCNGQRRSPRSRPTPKPANLLGSSRKSHMMIDRLYHETFSSPPALPRDPFETPGSALTMSDFSTSKLGGIEKLAERSRSCENQFDDR